MAGGLAARPWFGDECRFVLAGCGRTPRPSGLCDYHERRLELQGVTVRPDTHVRSLRMRPELARAVTVAARKLGMPENQFIVQAVRHVCLEAGIPVEEPEDEAEPVEDPFV